MQASVDGGHSNRNGLTVATKKLVQTRASAFVNGTLESGPLDNQIPEVVGHHPLRSMLRGIDTDNSEVFTTYFLDTWTDHSIRFLQRLPAWLGFVLLATASSDVVQHGGFSVIGESKGVDLNFPPQQSKLPTLQKKYVGDLSVIPGRVITLDVLSEMTVRHYALKVDLPPLQKHPKASHFDQFDAAGIHRSSVPPAVCAS